mgnify:CR=1 FL=1
MVVMSNREDKDGNSRTNWRRNRKDKKRYW